jgi:hypothetical protein
MFRKTYLGLTCFLKLCSRQSLYCFQRDSYLAMELLAKARTERRGGYNRCHIGYLDFVTYGVLRLVEMHG